MRKGPINASLFPPGPIRGVTIDGSKDPLIGEWTEIDQSPNSSVVTIIMRTEENNNNYVMITLDTDKPGKKRVMPFDSDLNFKSPSGIVFSLALVNTNQLFLLSNINVNELREKLRFK